MPGTEMPGTCPEMTGPAISLMVLVMIQGLSVYLVTKVASPDTGARFRAWRIICMPSVMRGLSAQCAKAIIETRGLKADMTPTLVLPTDVALAGPFELERLSRQGAMEFITTPISMLITATLRESKTCTVGAALMADALVIRCALVR